MRTTLGCSTPAMERASRKKRDRAVPSPARAWEMTLMATRRSSVTSSARNTWPIPPSPSEWRIRYPRMAGSRAVAMVLRSAAGRQQDAAAAGLDHHQGPLPIHEQPRGEGSRTRLRRWSGLGTGGQEPGLFALHDAGGGIDEKRPLLAEDRAAHADGELPFLGFAEESEERRVGKECRARGGAEQCQRRV